MNINPFNGNNPMSLKDAAIISSIAAFTVWILQFVGPLTIGAIRADPIQCLFEAARSYATGWAGIFLTLSGLEKLIQHAEDRTIELQKE